jgi:hypothetical protein
MKPKNANKTLKWFCHIWRCLLCLKDEQTIISRTEEGKGLWQNNFSVKKLKIVWPHLSGFSRHKSISEHGIAISKFGLRCSTAKAG